MADKTHCSFCGAPRAPLTPLIAGNDGYICEPCVQLAHQVVGSWGQRRLKQQLPELGTPISYKEHLDLSVIGQEAAKETLAIAIYNHYLRLLGGSGEPICQLAEQVEMEKANILMTGPSGTGKTLLVQTMARKLGVPFITVDATTLTQTGYVGDDVSSIIVRLLEAANGDVQQAQWGIVYLDEVDKLARRSGGNTSIRDISGEGVQQALLKMIEGCEVRVGKQGRRGEYGEEQLVDTRNILFIAGGAFPGLEELINQRITPQAGIGFHHQPRQQAQQAELLEALLPEDLHAFGLIPEFVGRFPIITFLEALDHSSLLRILSEPRNALVKQYRKLFAWQGVELHFSSQALSFIADQALDLGTGARGLRSVLEAALKSTMFNMPSMPQLRSCTLSLDSDDKGTSFLYVAQSLQEDKLHTGSNGGVTEPELQKLGLSSAP